MKKEFEIYKLLSKDKIKMNWNSNPIKIEDFIKMLKIDVKSEDNCLGYDHGWREYINKEHNLIVRGGLVYGSGLYLDMIQYGFNLDNPYNNYVNPFFLEEILTDEGFNFFLKYYEDDIKKILDNFDSSIIFHEKHIGLCVEGKNNVEKFLRIKK